MAGIDLLTYHAEELRPRVRAWLKAFSLDPLLAEHVEHVLLALPAPVRLDLLGDEAFAVGDYDPATGFTLRVPSLSSRGSRSVVLKRTLRRRSPEFIRWVIAHELAHAHLRNEGRWPGDDPEVAADALAAAWGFPRPVA